MKSKTEILRMTMLAMLIAIGVVISPILRIEGMCPMAHRASKGKLICAVLGEVIGTGIIGSIISYPIMAFLVHKSGLTWFFYTPLFITGTLIGGTIAFVFLAALRRTGMLTKIQRALGARTYDLSNAVSPASAADQS